MVQKRKFSFLSLRPFELEHLIYGFTILDGFPSPAIEYLEKLYRDNRDLVLGFIGQDIGAMVPGFLGSMAIPWGSRPHCWWRWDSPEPRRLISGNPDMIIPDSLLYFGIPRLYRQADHGCVFESQTDYLGRLNLLIPGESEKIIIEQIKV